MELQISGVSKGVAKAWVMTMLKAPQERINSPEQSEVPFAPPTDFGLGSALCRVGENALRAKPSRWCQPRPLDVVRAHNVNNSLARGKQIVSDDPAVASPPQGFGAHDSASSLAP